MSYATTSQSRCEVVGGTKVPDMRQRAWRGRVWKKPSLEFFVDFVHLFDYKEVMCWYMEAGNRHIKR